MRQMVMKKVRPLVLTTLVVLFSLGAAPLAKAQVEIYIRPDVVYALPGDVVTLTVAIVNNDNQPYRCELRAAVYTPTGHVIRYPDKHFPLRPNQTLSHDVTRYIPHCAPQGEYILVLELYDQGTGRLLDDAEAHIYVRVP
jgi:hypothetical protein